MSSSEIHGTGGPQIPVPPYSNRRIQETGSKKPTGQTGSTDKTMTTDQANSMQNTGAKGNTSPDKANLPGANLTGSNNLGNSKKETEKLGSQLAVGLDAAKALAELKNLKGASQNADLSVPPNFLQINENLRSSFLTTLREISNQRVKISQEISFTNALTVFKNRPGELEMLLTLADKIYKEGVVQAEQYKQMATCEFINIGIHAAAIGTTMWLSKQAKADFAQAGTNEAAVRAASTTYDQRSQMVREFAQMGTGATEGAKNLIQANSATALAGLRAAQELYRNFLQDRSKCDDAMSQEASASINSQTIKDILDSINNASATIAQHITYSSH